LNDSNKRCIVDISPIKITFTIFSTTRNHTVRKNIHNYHLILFAITLNIKKPFHDILLIYYTHIVCEHLPTPTIGTSPIDATIAITSSPYCLPTITFRSDIEYSFGHRVILVSFRPQEGVFFSNEKIV
jgi:hypothetical protein